MRKFDKFLLKKTDQIIPCYKNQDILKSAKKNNSWVVKKNGIKKYGFDGFILIISHSRFFWPLEYILKIYLFTEL